MSTPTLFDTIQHWLQGAVNDATAGYASRLAFLDGYTSGLCQRIDELEKTNRMQATQIEILSRLMQRVDEAEARITELCQEVPRIDDLQRAVNNQADKVQAMLVPQTMDADTLLQKLRGAEDWHDAVADEVFGSPAFTTALDEEVFEGHKLDEAVKAIVNDLDFKVTVS